MSWSSPTADQALVESAGAALALPVASVRVDRAAGLPLQQALTLTAGQLGTEAVALVTGQREYRLARLTQGGTLVGRDDRPLELRGVYAIRCFAAAGDLRWRSPIGAASICVLIRDLGSPDLPELPSCSQHRVITLEQRTLLWGEALAPSADGWTALAAARVGTIDVPIGGLAAADRVQLLVDELITFNPDGNARVIDQRMRALVIAERQEAPRG